MINSRRHYCRSNRIAFRELDSFAQDVSEVHKRSLMFNTRWKRDGGGSAQQERILCQNFVDLRRYRRSSMAKSLVATSTKSESNFEVGLPRTVRQQPTFVFWRETFSSTFSSGAKMSRAFACADQRLMASPLRQTSHSAMYRGFLTPFFFCGCWCNFFHRPLLQDAGDVTLGRVNPERTQATVLLKIVSANSTSADAVCCDIDCSI